MSSVELREYDPAWESAFEAEEERLHAQVGEGLLGVYHIGSTAVPGLIAKPVIDILAVYETRGDIDRAKERLTDRYRIHRDEPDRTALIWQRDTLPVTLHMRPRTADGWEEQLVFRELLREDPEARAEYEGAKRTAAAEYPDDIPAYTAAKEPVISELMEQAYREGYDEGIPNPVSGDT